jgi:hypothetical protein
MNAKAYWSPYNAYSGNQSSLTGSQLVLFNDSFEHEKAGTIPDFSYKISPTTTNMSISVINMSGSHNQVLDLNGTGVSLGWPGDALVGHDMTGIFNFSFDFYMNYWYKTSGDPCLQVGLIDVTHTYWNPNVIFEHSLGFPEFYMFPGAYNSTTGNTRLSWLGGNAPFVCGTWYHYSVQVNTYNQSSLFFVNSVATYFEHFSHSVSVFSMIGIMVLGQTDAATIADYRIDNLQVSVTKRSLQTYPDPTDSRTAISIMFDDAYLSSYTNASIIMGSYPGTLVLPIERVRYIGAPAWMDDRMNWSQVQALVNDGWEVMAHSVNHTLPGMLALSTQDQIAQFRLSKLYIQQNLSGYTPIGWAYPFDQCNDATNTIGLQYYAYLRNDENDLGQYALMSDIADSSDMFNLARCIPALVYGYYGYIPTFTHQVTTYDDPNHRYDGNVNNIAFDYFIDKLEENNSRVVTPNEYYQQFRNSQVVEVTGSASSFTTTFDSSHGNFTMDKTWFELPQGSIYGVGSYNITSTGTWGLLGIGTHAQQMTILTSSSKLDLEVNMWSATHRLWAVNSGTANPTVTFTLSGLESGAQYYVKIDGNREHQLWATGSGTISFTYAGPWSEHTFEVVRYNSPSHDMTAFSITFLGIVVVMVLFMLLLMMYEKVKKAV